LYNISPKSLIVGKELIYLPTCHSTNLTAHDYLSKSSNEGLVIITANQTAGKGQRGNNWESEPGSNLTFSIILYPSFLEVRNQFYLSKIISLAIIDVLTTKLGEKIKIKWPNDIYFDDKKLGGILIENILTGHKLKASIIGIGLNVNQTEFSYQQATSIINLYNKITSLPELLTEVLESIDKWYSLLSNNNYDLISTQYESRLLGRNIVRKFKTDRYFEGMIIGVNEQGQLKIKVENETLNFDFKEVEYLHET
jgi:BirA family biotin operon repressor/biotin-[acetyl-CoA-carboxylase] ligase